MAKTLLLHYLMGLREMMCWTEDAWKELGDMIRAVKNGWHIERDELRMFADRGDVQDQRGPQRHVCEIKSLQWRFD